MKHTLSHFWRNLICQIIEHVFRGGLKAALKQPCWVITMCTGTRCVSTPSRRLPFSSASAISISKETPGRQQIRREIRWNRTRSVSNWLPRSGIILTICRFTRCTSLRQRTTRTSNRRRRTFNKQLAAWPTFLPKLMIFQAKICRPPILSRVQSQKQSKIYILTAYAFFDNRLTLAKLKTRK